MKWMRLIGFLCVLISIGTGCRTVPITGRSQLMFSSESEESALGMQAFSEYKQKYPQAKNATQVAMLKSCGAAIKAVAIKEGGADWQWEFAVLESAEANAFCLPGGKVAVYSGLFNYVANEAELAVVVAHEIAHALARHGGERMSWGDLQTLGSLGISKAFNNETVNMVYGVGTQLGVMLPYSRANETEADMIGLTLMARAGYNPQAALTFWKKFGGQNNASILEQFLSTHPQSADRIKDMSAALPKAMEIYQKAPVKRNLGMVMTR